MAGRSVATNYVKIGESVLKGSLSWHGALQWPSTWLILCFRNYRIAHDKFKILQIIKASFTFTWSDARRLWCESKYGYGILKASWVVHVVCENVIHHVVCWCCNIDRDNGGSVSPSPSLDQNLNHALQYRQASSIQKSVTRARQLVL